MRMATYLCGLLLLGTMACGGGSADIAAVGADEVAGEVRRDEDPGRFSGDEDGSSPAETGGGLSGGEAGGSRAGGEVPLVTEREVLQTLCEWQVDCGRVSPEELEHCISRLEDRYVAVRGSDPREARQLLACYRCVVGSGCYEFIDACALTCGG